MKRALYAGSFDPITVGHLDVIYEAIECFDELTVALLKNPFKPTLREDKRYEWTKRVINGSFGRCSYITVVNCLQEDVLTVDVAKRERAGFLVRGVKGVTNWEEEMQLAFNNKKLAPSLTTVWFPVSQTNFHVSSTAVRSILKCVEDERDLIRKLSLTYLPPSIVLDVVENRDLYL